MEIRKWKENLKIGCKHILVSSLLFENYFLAIAVKIYVKSIYQNFLSLFNFSNFLTFLHSYIFTFFYFFTSQNILSLILGSVSTILLSWLNSRNKMLACSVSVTWLFWLKVSSCGFAFYFQHVARGGTLVYGVSIQNSASISSTT